jgi:hypothetical protein
MQLPIEQWLSEANLPQEATVAFSEAVRCFKAGAYRAALLFSYLGWGLSLRIRILTAQCPSGIAASLWAGIGQRLRNEDRWDDEVFECTQRMNPAPIFEVSEDLRRQVRFWRDRRNDCAHFKVNEIGSPYVESFWQFVRSNLPKFVPRGSQAALIEEILRFFDPNQTPPGSDIGPIVALIAPSIETSSLADFFREVVDNMTVTVGAMKLRRAVDLSKFFEGVLRLSNQQLTTPLAGYLAGEHGLLLNLLRSSPSRVLVWSDHSTLVRLLWRSLLFESGHQDLPVYAALLRNRLIPDAEISEANLWVVSRLNGDLPMPEDLPVLLASGFIRALGEYAFDQRKIDDFNWGNRNALTARWYLENFPITVSIARIICSVFHGPPFPYSARDALGSLFANDSAKRAELEHAAVEANIEVPSTILTEERIG